MELLELSFTHFWNGYPQEHIQEEMALVPSFYLPAGKQPFARCFLPFFAASRPGPTLPPPTGQRAAGSSGLSTKMMVHLSRYAGTRVVPGTRKPTPLLPGVQWPSQTYVRPGLPPFPVPGPGATRCCTALLCYACCVPMRPAVHGGPSASFPAPADKMRRIVSCETP